MMLGLGRSLVLGGPVGAVSAETQQFLDRLPTLPSSSLRGHYNTFINGLVDAGIFDAFDALYLFSVETGSAACVNLVQDRFPLDTDTTGGTITFAGLSPTPADAGWTSTLNGRLVTYEDLSTATSLKIAQNDASIFCWNKLATAVGGFRDIRAVASGGSFIDTLSLFSRYTPNYVGGTCNANDPTGQIYRDDNTDGSGFYVVQRTGANVQEFFKDAVALTQNGGSTGATAASVALPAGYLANLPQRHSRAFGFGRALSSQECSDLYDLLSAFITSTAGGIP